MSGMYGLGCFNGLDPEQQQRLVEWGNLPFGYEPNGPCQNPAEVEVTTVWDRFPGPRFYCAACGIEYLRQQAEGG